MASSSSIRGRRGEMTVLLEKLTYHRPQRAREAKISCLNSKQSSDILQSLYPEYSD